MPRPVARPPFSDTPGAWLANYRYRQRGESGQPSSAEQVGALLGVSGPTLRRWETGRARPSGADLRRFAEVCGLMPIETEFLRRAFLGQQREEAPDEATFRAAASELLSTDFPAYILDTFFFTRAWNSYADALFDVPTDPQVHVLSSLLRAVVQGRGTPEWERRIQRRLRDFWLSTASPCGSEPYKRVLASLCAEPGFEERWCRLALEPGDLVGQVIRAPYDINTERFGAFRVFPARMVLPPIYELREYVPLDAKARRRLETFRELRSPAIGFSAYVHWAVDPRLSPE